MSRVLATFSGKFGDCLWSLPTVRELAFKHRPVLTEYPYEPVDFAIMLPYRSLLPLLGAQPYIASARVLDDWICTGSPHGDQPWQPPAKYEEGYDHVYHLTYRQHPGMGVAPNLPLADYIAWQQGLTLTQPVVPFIEVPNRWEKEPLSICFGFNESQAETKTSLVYFLRKSLPATVQLVNVATMPWVEAAERIAGSGFFIGCRSATWVVAMGVGAETFTFEPNSSRNAYGPYGKVFGCPYGKETAFHFTQTPESAADIIVEKILSVGVPQ
jgi:hypothetical protein